MPHPSPAVGLDGSWALNGSVALRPEPFGALAYDFGTRRLSFLKSPQLVDVVRALGASRTVGDALAEAGVAAGDHPAYLSALTRLARAGMVVPQETG